jgi:hypothetical protein
MQDLPTGNLQGGIHRQNPDHKTRRHTMVTLGEHTSLGNGFPGKDQISCAQKCRDQPAAGKPAAVPPTAGASRFRSSPSPCAAGWQYRHRCLPVAGFPRQTQADTRPQQQDARGGSPWPSAAMRGRLSWSPCSVTKRSIASTFTRMPPILPRPSSSEYVAAPASPRITKGMERVCGGGLAGALGCWDVESGNA